MFRRRRSQRERLRNREDKDYEVKKLIRKAREGFSYFYKGAILYYAWFYISKNKKEERR